MDAAISRLAAQQHGVVSGRQLRELGLGYGAIKHRVNAGRLRRLRRAVYLVGPTLLPLSLEMAAILACGEGAAISHHTAAGIHQLLPHPAQPGLIHVTVTGSDRGPKPGIRVHRPAIRRDELTSRHRIPITTPARTILDLAPDLEIAALEQVLAQAHRTNLATVAQLDSLITRYPRRPGTPALKTVLQGPGEPKLTRSKSERRMLEAFRRAALPEPGTNASLAGYEVDFLWVSARLVVEIDGQPFHSARPDRRRDHERDAHLGELGYAVLRLDADVAPERAVALVAAALGRGATR
jgi:very-short-patch-repair endonuclease